MTNPLTVEEVRKRVYLFNNGEYFDSHLFFGSHFTEYLDKKGFTFRVWAPNAHAVYLVSDFTGWEEGVLLENFENSGVWIGFFENANEGDHYKYRILQQDWTEKLKIDPYGFEFEVRPADASVVRNLPNKNWTDHEWYEKKEQDNLYTSAINIYEMHISSWKHHEDGSWYTIKELQDELIPYVKKLGYTHIEFMPLMEHPLDASWGYQITGYFAFSSKYGSANDFQDFVEACHNEGIGVLVDWVPGHFNRNDYALSYFDGTPQYEYRETVKADNVRWGALNFDLGKTQVHSFLISNAMYWLDYFHLDGIRVDAVSNMIYLDMDEGEWIPNEDGSNHNREGIKFLQKLNREIFKRHPNVLMVAEESSDWPGVTTSTDYGGLGFNFKWNMGWMNDTLKFFEMDPEYRKHHYDLITFSFMYAFNENFILPISHDEVVHGKKSLVHKMFGDRYNQFAAVRVIETYRMTHPGKKLHFMGTEFGQFIEWRFWSELDWLNLTDPVNQKHLHFTETLNHLYKQEPALYEIDNSWKGLEIIDADNNEDTVLSYIRHSSNPDDYLVVILNFRPYQHEHFQVGVPKPGTYEEVFNTELEEYGGKWTGSNKILKTSNHKKDNYDQTVELIVPSLGAVILKPLDISIEAKENQESFDKKIPLTQTEGSEGKD